MSKQNPYRRLILAKSTGFSPVDAGSGYRLPGQGSNLMDSKGEINASDTKDLLGQLGRIIAAFNQGEMINSRQPVSAEVRNEKLAELRAAFDDVSGTKARMLGEAMAVEVIDSANREGFARRLLQYREIGAGELNQIRVREHDVWAWLAVSTANVTPTIVRNRLIIPPEFNIECFPLIDLMTLNQTTADLLEEKYEEALGAIMVQEDRLWKRIADQVAIVRNTLQFYTTMSPSIFTRLRTQVSQWGIPVTTALLAYDLWNDLVGNTEFTGNGLFDPVTKWELIQQGYLGTLLGVTLITDSFRQPTLRVLNAGEVYMVGAPVNHGVMTMRAGMTVEPINRYPMGQAAKGWFMNEIISMVVANATSVAKGQRS